MRAGGAPTGAPPKPRQGTATQPAHFAGGQVSTLSPALATEVTTRLQRKVAELKSQNVPKRDALMRLADITPADIATNPRAYLSTFDKFLVEAVTGLLHLGTPQRAEHPPSVRRIMGLDVVVDHASYPGTRTAVCVAYALDNFEVLASSGAAQLRKAATKLAAEGLSTRLCWVYTPHKAAYAQLLRDAGWRLVSGRKAQDWLATQAPHAVGIEDFITSQWPVLEPTYERFHKDYTKALSLVAPYGLTSLDQPGLPREVAWALKLGYRCLTVARRHGCDIADATGRGGELLSRDVGAGSFTWSVLNESNYVERVWRNELGVYFVLWRKTDRIAPVRAWHASLDTVKRYAKRELSKKPTTKHLVIPVWWLKAHATELTPADPHKVIRRPRRHNEDTRLNRHRASPMK